MPRLLAASIVLAEFVGSPAPRIGGEAALVRIRFLKDMGMRVLNLGEREALAAGSLCARRHTDRRHAHSISGQDWRRRICDHGRSPL